MSNVEANGELEGFFYKLSFEDYASVPALNGSSIVHMRRSPMSYRHQKDNPTAPSPAMELGTITHRMILEPELVGQIAVWGAQPDQKVRNGKAWEQFQFDHQDQTILTVEDFKACTAMALAARRHAPIREYADAFGPTEVSMFWRHPYTRRRYKARLDKIVPGTHTIFDLKTTRDCHSYKFGGQAYALGYYIKLALYWQGYRELTGVEPSVRIGAIDSKPPHESVVYRVSRDVIMQGIEELDQLVARLDECEMSGCWPPEYEGETDLILPAWTNSFDEVSE